MSALVDYAVASMHDRWTECPSSFDEGTCGGNCGWTRGLREAVEAGLDLAADVMDHEAAVWKDGSPRRACEVGAARIRALKEGPP